VPLYGDGRSGTFSTVPGVYGAYLQSLSGNIHPEIVRLSQVVSQPAVIVIAGTGFGNDPFGTSPFGDAGGITAVGTGVATISGFIARQGALTASGAGSAIVVASDANTSVATAGGTGSATVTGFDTVASVVIAIGVGGSSVSGIVSKSAVLVATGVGAASIAGVVTLIERLIPDAILDMVGLSGSVSLVQDDPDSADANWLVAA
jgi:hypothetical protein